MADITIAEFEKEALAFLEANAERRVAEKAFVWGEGADTFYRERDREQEERERMFYAFTQRDRDRKRNEEDDAGRASKRNPVILGVVLRNRQQQRVEIIGGSDRAGRGIAL